MGQVVGFGCMRETCHRCGEELPAGSGESPFCPHCGTPQLTLSLENQSVETGGDPPPGPDGTPSTGATPPPLPRQVDWPMAIRCAAAVAGMASLLTLLAMRVDRLWPVSLVWMMGGSLVTLGLYQRRRPAAWMDARVGARIGLMVGLCLALGVTTVVAGWGVVARFGLHAMGGFDAAITEVLVEGQRRSAQWTSQPTPPEMLALVKTPEFHAVYVLIYCVVGSGVLLAVSTVGGAFAGMMRMRRSRVA
jgi:hypothetical protein